MTDDDVLEPKSVREGGSDPQLPVSLSKLRWSKSTVNFWLDAALAVVFVVLMTVSTVVRCVFPSPTAAAGWTLWGYDYDQWLRGQFLVLCTLGVGVVLHVMLHWSWVCGMLTRGKSKSSLRTDNGVQTIVGVLFLAAALHVIGAVVLAGMVCIVRP
jgi:hypothetical protein